MDSEQDLLRLHLEHSTQRFTSAAAQRMQAVNFFLATASILCGTAVSVPHDHLKLRLCLIAATFTVTVLFYLIEVRSKNLVNESEKAMEECLRVFREENKFLDDSRLRIDSKSGVLTYGKIINLIYGLAASVEVFAFGYFFCLALNMSCIKEPGEQQQTIHCAALSEGVPNSCLTELDKTNLNIHVNCAKESNTNCSSENKGTEAKKHPHPSGSGPYKSTSCVEVDL